MEGIRIITTGGTFDKLYDAIKGELTFRESHLPRILQQSRCTLPITLETVLAVDSLNMTEEQRSMVSDHVASSFENRIVVTHGTDTMVATAKVVASNKLLEGKTVVFTGAMIPYSLENSDAVFNLGVAISAVQLLPPGVYIAMGGRIFGYDNVRKNKEKGIFEELR